MSYIEYIFKNKRDIEPARFATVANLFYDKQYEILLHYEHKLESSQQMNSALIKQLREYLCELMLLNASTSDRFV